MPSHFLVTIFHPLWRPDLTLVGRCEEVKDEREREIGENEMNDDKEVSFIHIDKEAKPFRDDHFLYPNRH